MRKPDETLLGDLSVAVVCELGQLTLSARELLELAPGAVLPLGKPAGGAVELTCGGRHVARGELVEMDGELGIRILEIVGG